MRPLILSLLALVALPAAQGPRTFTGTITDNVCADADHSSMRMGPTDAECTLACVDAHGATYRLYDGHTSFMLSDQRLPETFAGKKVDIAGTLEADGKTIQVASITAAR